jgi:CRISPR-associated protein Cpf1
MISSKLPSRLLSRPVKIVNNSTTAVSVSCLILPSSSGGNNSGLIGVSRISYRVSLYFLFDVSATHLTRYLTSVFGILTFTDYHQLLDNKEKERNLAKKDWQTIENIKELKEGYLSQVINRISNLMIKYNAIIVLEDLNSGFKRGRQKVEKQVYQKFEKMLIDKLNFLVNKKAKNGEICSLRNALQLTNKFEGFQNIGKQNGFIFYVPAWNTSKMDPTTGFVNLIDTRYKSIEESKKLFNNFQSITYNKKELYFEFHIHDYKLFNTISDGTKTDWIICSYGDRIITERNKNQNRF